MSLADRIKQGAADFTPAEHRIAQALFSSNLLAGLETVARLGERAKVSGPTVLRFASKLGFENYADFQDALRADIEARLASPLDTYEERGLDPRRDLPEDAARVMSGAVDRSLSRIDPGKLERLGAMLADETRPVHVIGGRFTHHIAEILWGHLHMLRARAHILRGGVVAPSDYLVDFGRRDILVIFDIRRYQRSTIDLAEFAKLRRATIVLITDPLLSPIARIANHVLTADLDSPSPHDSLVSCLALAEGLVAAATRAAGEGGRQRVIEIEQLRAFGDADDSTAAG